MPAPAQIINSLESILGILFSNIHYKERAAYILCDNLVELCCRIKIKEKNPKDNVYRKFYQSLNDSNVPKSLSRMFQDRHNTRNDMQHDDLRTTVDIKENADFVLDIISLIRKFWGKYAFQNVDDWLECSFRVTRLYSSTGKMSVKKRFEYYIQNEIDFTSEELTQKLLTLSDESDEMHDVDENNRLIPTQLRKRIPKKYELIIPVNSKESLGLVIQEFTQHINQILDELELEE
jgi:hypothetical protein